MSTAETIELIKTIGSVVVTIISAGSLAYARIAAKRSKEASEQTKTRQRVDGQMSSSSAAETSEEALYLVKGLVPIVRDIRAELANIPGGGRRRATDSEEEPWIDSPATARRSPPT